MFACCLRVALTLIANLSSFVFWQVWSNCFVGFLVGLYSYPSDLAGKGPKNSSGSGSVLPSFLSGWSEKWYFHIAWLVVAKRQLEWYRCSVPNLLPVPQLVTELLYSIIYYNSNFGFKKLIWTHISLPSWRFLCSSCRVATISIKDLVKRLQQWAS